MYMKIVDFFSVHKGYVVGFRVHVCKCMYWVQS